MSIAFLPKSRPARWDLRFAAVDKGPVTVIGLDSDDAEWIAILPDGRPASIAFGDVRFGAITDDALPMELETTP